MTSVFYIKKIRALISGLLIYTWFLLQFDALVAALPISESGEEAQLKRISELQVWKSQLTECSLYVIDWCS